MDFVDLKARMVLLFLSLLLAGCAAGSTPTKETPVMVAETPTFAGALTAEVTPSQLPDLTIRSVYLEMEGRRGNCVPAYTPYGIRVVVENAGRADAGAFSVDLNGAREMVEDGLAAGGWVELHFPGTHPSGMYRVVLDEGNKIPEMNEGNNSQAYSAPTPTPPPLCTATASAGG